MQKLVLIATVLLSSPSIGQSISAADQEALQKTQELLRSKNLREKAAQGDAQAKSVEDNVKQLMGGGEASEGVFDLAASIFKNIVEESNGDVDKMNELLQKYQQDPAAFAKKWTPEQKAKLKELSNKVRVPTSNK